MIGELGYEKIRCYGNMKHVQLHSKRVSIVLLQQMVIKKKSCSECT